MVGRFAAAEVGRETEVFDATLGKPGAASPQRTDAREESAFFAVGDKKVNYNSFPAATKLYLKLSAIKGFAVTLCVGIVTTVLTAVYLTRIYYDYRIGARRLTRISI